MVYNRRSAFGRLDLCIRRNAGLIHDYECSMTRQVDRHTDLGNKTDISIPYLLHRPAPVWKTCSMIAQHATMEERILMGNSKENRKRQKSYDFCVTKRVYRSEKSDRKKMRDKLYGNSQTITCLSSYSR